MHEDDERVEALRAGQQVGTLCVFDERPRSVAEKDLAAPRDLAAWVEKEMALDGELVRGGEVQRHLPPVRPPAVEGDGEVIEIGRTRRGSATVQRPEGRVNMVPASDVRRAVAEAVDEGTPRLVVDPGATTFLDSSGLGSLVAGLKTARKSGGDLRVAAVTDQALRVLRLTNLDRVLKPHATVEDALDGW